MHWFDTVFGGLLFEGRFRFFLLNILKSLQLHECYVKNDSEFWCQVKDFLGGCIVLHGGRDSRLQYFSNPAKRTVQTMKVQIQNTGCFCLISSLLCFLFICIHLRLRPDWGSGVQQPSFTVPHTHNRSGSTRNTSLAQLHDCHERRLKRGLGGCLMIYSAWTPFIYTHTHSCRDQTRVPPKHRCFIGSNWGVAWQAGVSQDPDHGGIAPCRPAFFKADSHSRETTGGTNDINKVYKITRYVRLNYGNISIKQCTKQVFSFGAAIKTGTGLNILLTVNII